MADQEEKLRDYHKGFLIVGILSFGLVYGLLEYHTPYPLTEQFARTLGGTMALLMAPFLSLVFTLNKPARSRFFFFVVIWGVVLVLMIIGVLADA